MICLMEVKETPALIDVEEGGNVLVVQEGGREIDKMNTFVCLFHVADSMSNGGFKDRTMFVVEEMDFVNNDEAD